MHFFQRSLVCVCFSLMLVSSLWASTEEKLSREAKALLESTWAQVDPHAVDAVAVNTLNESANVLRQQKACSMAYRVRSQAFRSGLQQTAHSWLMLAKDAACAKYWERGSQVAFLSLKLASNKIEVLSAQSLLARLLEQRSSWSNDWKPLAIHYYQQLLAEKEVAWIRARMSDLEQVQLEKKELKITDTRAENTRRFAALCVTFNDDLPQADDFHIEDYVVHTPSFKATYQVKNSTVCLHGAAYGQSYQVKLRQGLSTEHKQLVSDQVVNIQTGDRESSIWFKRSAYVLPLHQASNVPLYALNTASVELSLYRIHERNILSPFVQQNFQQRLYPSDVELLKNRLGEAVFSAKKVLSQDKNTTHIHGLSLDSEWIKQPGLYVLLAKDSANDAPSWRKLATQWLVVTDIGLSSYQANNGLHLVARSLYTGKPLSGVHLTLLAQNNQPLGQGETDDQGLLRFDPGLLRGKNGQKAVQVTAFSPQAGFSFLSLTQPAFDLSDRGVGGKMSKGELDAFLYLDRGVYRPKESVHLTTLLRNHKAQAVHGLPLRLRLMNPQGNVVSDRVMKPDQLGGYAVEIPLLASASTGRWTLEAFLSETSVVLGKAHFLVEMVAPPRMEASLSAKGVLRASDPIEVTFSADYLFGAPVTDRPVTTGLFIEKSTQPFANFSDYQFGVLGEAYKTTQIKLETHTTDAQGKVKFLVSLPAIKATHQPLMAHIYAEVMDVDGRQVSAKKAVLIGSDQLYIGVQKQFSDRVSHHQSANFKVVMLDYLQTLQKGSVTWQLIEENMDYQWFQSGGEWQYERLVNEHVVQTGEIALSDNDPIALAMTVADGHYRLEVSHAAKKAMSSVKFVVGEGVSSESDTPDAVELSLDKASYLSGELAQLQITSPYEGELSVVIAGDDLHQIQNISMDGLTHQLPIQVHSDWGAGVYALVSVFHPGKDGAEGAKRALGVIWINRDPRSHQLNVTVDIEAQVAPRQTIDVAIGITGHDSESVYVTLAAVDEGVLSLTGFQSPSPIDYFFGKHRLGTDIRDAYGKLIDPVKGEVINARSGGDSAGNSRRGLPSSHIDIVSLFSGVVDVVDGQASIPLTLPDYNGRLRLMVVAWSQDKLGATDKSVSVVDPVVVQSSLPRFLALHDRSQLSVQLHNLKGQSGQYQVVLESSGGVENTSLTTQLVTLEKGQKHHLDFNIQANQLGDHTLLLKVIGDDVHYEKSIGISVRGQSLPLIQRRYESLSAGESLSLSANQFDHLMRDGLTLSTQISSQSGLDVPSILQQLALYPHGCLEQLTSRALPLLYWEDLADTWGLAHENGVKQRLQSAIDRILSKQLSNGGFTLWDGGYDVDQWASVYALDFLVRAKKQGYQVNDRAYNKGVHWLENQAKTLNMNRSEDLVVLAYVHYMLAQVGKGQAENVRYLVDTHQSLIPTLLANAQLAATLTLLGDQARGSQLFQVAIEQHKRDMTWQDYGSALRDLAATMSLLNETDDSSDLLAGLMPELVLERQEKDWLSTQEIAWLVMASRFVDQATPINIGVNDQIIQSDNSTLNIDPDVDHSTVITNNGLKPLWITTTSMGILKQYQPSVSDEFSLSRTWFSVKGKEIDPEQVQQGDVIIALVKGVSRGKRYHQAMVVDLIPAGFELENPRLLNGLSLDRFSWLPDLSATKFVEVLDDRYVAALDIPAEKDKTFTLAYILRAVVKGEYRLPAIEIEDMYQPTYRATGDLGRAVIH